MSFLTTIHFICMILAVQSPITNHSNGNTLLTLLAGELAWLTAFQCNFRTTRGRSNTAGCHQLICNTKKKKKCHTLQQLNLKNYFSTEKKKMKLITSSAAEDLNTQVERVSELHGNDAQVASPDKPAEPAGHRGPTHHPYFKHLDQDQKHQTFYAHMPFISLHPTQKSFLHKK